MRRCSFCGKKTVIGNEVIIQAGLSINACSDCNKKYYQNTTLEKAKYILEKGYPLESEIEIFKTYISEEESKIEKIKAEEDAYKERNTSGKCPKCGNRMIKYRTLNLVYNDTTSFIEAEFFRMQSNGYAPTYSFTPVVCESCKYTEFYSEGSLPFAK